MFAVLQVADFSLQAVLRIERELAGRPVALLDDTRKPPVIVACTAPATAAGVSIGSTAPQAMARCAGIVLRTRSLPAETDARAGLLATAFAIAPQVEDTGPGLCTIQVAGVAADRRASVLAAAVAQLARLGLTATAGLAATPLLALFAARYGAAEEETPSAQGQTSNAQLPTPDTKGEAAPADRTRVAGVHESPGSYGESAPSASLNAQPSARSGPCHSLPTKPDGDVRLHPRPAHSGAASPSQPSAPAAQLPPPSHRSVCSIPAGGAHAFLADQPIAVAEPTREVAAILAGWGVQTLGQLTALAKAEVTHRLGPEGLALWERAAGEVTRPLQLINPPQTFAAAMDLEQPVETLEPLLFILRRFIDRLALELGNAGFVAGEMTLRLALADETTYAHDFRLPEPTAREEILFRVLQTHLETLRTSAAVQAVGFSCRPVRPWTRQQGLFDSALRDPHGFAETLGRLSAVVGPDRVGTPVVENTHRPDAFRLEQPPPVVPPGEKTPGCPPYGPPLRRYRPPVPAKVELQGQTPVFVWAANVAGPVRGLAGPWRGSGQWWDAAHAWRREEWDVELETGGLYRVLHTPEGWFVEGEYD